MGTKQNRLARREQERRDKQASIIAHGLFREDNRPVHGCSCDECKRRQAFQDQQAATQEPGTYLLVYGLKDPSTPLGPGTGHCPNCGAHAPMSQKVCRAEDCLDFDHGKPK